ncbi:MAG TPA: hypothetical protein VHC22_22345 [Pirellulales bacterium]|nr:hypothetical protein [Pirellulales bacterium]
MGEKSAVKRRFCEARSGFVGCSKGFREIDLAAFFGFCNISRSQPAVADAYGTTLLTRPMCRLRNPLAADARGHLLVMASFIF